MKKLLSLLLCICLCFTMLSGCAGDEKTDSGSDLFGRIVAHRGTPQSDDSIDKVWATAPAVELKKTSGTAGISATVKTLWDDINLYILVEVADSDVTDKDAVTAYIDTLWDRSEGYDSTDIKYSVASSGATGEVAVPASNSYFVTDGGYAVEMTFDLNSLLDDGRIMGIDICATDYSSDGSKQGTVSLFDNSGLCETDTSALGMLVISGKRKEAAPINKECLVKLARRMEATDYAMFGASETISQAIELLDSTYTDKNSTLEDVIAAMNSSHKTVYRLVDASDFPQAKDIADNTAYPDPFTFLDGRKMEAVSDWIQRRKEISDMYQYYMYGVWRDGSDERVTYDYNNGSLTVKIERLSTGAKTHFTATVMLPEKTVKAPSKNGYPLVVGMHSGISEETALANGFATITIDWFSYGIASDDTKHTGAFYDLYPYGNDWREQTGVLMAWGWGCSKILDALEAGLGEELNIDPENAIVTGVSRWGKAAAVAGAYETRFRMVAPSCSGAGGLAAFRYLSKGRVYDFSSKGQSAFYTYGDNEQIGNLQSSGEVGWFCNNFKLFKTSAQLPFDQYELAALSADTDRYMFIIGSCVYEDWVNAPAMWYTYLGAKEVYDALGISDNIKINIHASGHAVIEEDMRYMTQYFKQMVYGIEPTDDLSVLDTSVFALEQNVDHSMDDFMKDWAVGKF